ncbi:MAG: DUF4393 domain-containing protein [Rhodospirillales bacterium]
MADEKDEKTGIAELAHRALGEAADEFSEGSKGVGAALGRVALTGARTVEVALLPCSALVWGYDKIKERVIPGVTKKLANVPEDRIGPPDPMIAGPALEALRFAGHKDELREMFENLLANAIDQKTAESAHPSFVEILKQITPDEAKILRYLSRFDKTPIIDILLRRADNLGFWRLQQNFSCIGKYARCENQNLVPALIDNLCRLGIYFIREGESSQAEGFYDEVDNHPEVAEKKIALKNAVEEESASHPSFLMGLKMLPPIQELRIVTDHKLLRHTSYGRQFMASCVVPKE